MNSGDLFRKTYFEKNLERSQTRMLHKSGEPIYVKKYLYHLLQHLQQIKIDNPGITEEQMNEKLSEEIDNYSVTVYENSDVFTGYMEYICAQYFVTHPDKYKEISESVKNSDIDYENSSYQNCDTFDDYLSLYVYRLKKDLFLNLFNDYLKPSPEKFKNFDDILKKDKKFLSKSFFRDYYSLPEVSDVLCDDNLPKAKKVAKLKEFSTWYKLSTQRRDFLKFANIFLNGSYSFLTQDTSELEKNLKRDLASSTEKLVTQLDSLGHLDDYIVSYVSQMCDIGFPEFATLVCNNGQPNSDFIKSLEGLPNWSKNKKIKEIISPEKVKTYLSENYLYNPKTISLESLLALNSFWSNRYAKELELYAEAMFAVYDFNLIPKVLEADENTRINIDITEEELSQMLLKIGVLYVPASQFIRKKQIEFDNRDFSEDENNEINSDGKIIRFSYEPFVNKIVHDFSSQNPNVDGNEYSAYFSEVLPHSANNLEKDANLYAKLYNPIISSYSMKDESINCLISSIDNSVCTFPNAGIILDSISEDGTHSDLCSFVGIGIDAGLSFPARIHMKRYTLLDFLNSVNGNAVVPIYAGSEDFANISVPLILPLTDKHRTTLKKATKNLSKYKNPNFIAHLGFVDSKHTPEHLRTTSFDSRGRTVKSFEKKYIDLETGDIYQKSDDTYEKVAPKVFQRKGEDECEL
jgi:hypothetical protein